MKTAAALSGLCLALAALPAQAASTDVVFKGGGTITRVSGCTGETPDKQFFVGTYLTPVAGSTNGDNTILTFHFDGHSSEGFQKNDGRIGSTFEKVWNVHISDRLDSFDPMMRITSQSPSTITATTQSVVVSGAVKGWNRGPNCIVFFTMRLTRDLLP
ncbi:hypothetical protein [Methylobrevis albus]|uniref:Secreted protein n=1 Tax=Methylobrevis albus TaxID=2793297 RepID=A0A931I1J2_9HYPH|nr:hypothetical protein [Methylobrevis albus]MBH0237573.1 hypothetical protein [Methylobrevis albus]